MWQIIKAEYKYSLLTGIWNLIGALAIIALISFWNHNLTFAVTYIFFGGIILSFLDENRFYIFQTLPIKPKQIAFARLLMLGINFTVLLVIIIPIIILTQMDLTDTINNLFMFIGGLLIVRIFSFSLLDITSGLFQRKRRKYLFLLFSFIAPIMFVFIYVTTVYFRKPELSKITLVLSYSLIPILAFISVKTFLAKEKITIREN